MVSNERVVVEGFLMGNGGMGIAACMDIGGEGGSLTIGTGGAEVKNRFPVRIGPAAFRIGSAWPAPISLLRTLYADYPQPEDGIADFSVRLDPAKPLRRWLSPSVSLACVYFLPDPPPFPLALLLLSSVMGFNIGFSSFLFSFFFFFF